MTIENVKKRQQATNWWNRLSYDDKVIRKHPQALRHETMNGQQIQETWENSVNQSLKVIELRMDDGNVLFFNLEHPNGCGVKYWKEIESCYTIDQEVIDFAESLGHHIEQCPRTEKIQQWHLLNATPEDVINFANEHGYRVPDTIYQLILMIKKEGQNAT